MTDGAAQIRAARAAAAEPAEEIDDRALADHPLSDLGNARRLIARHGRDLLALGATRPEWLVWDGYRWNRQLGAAEALKRAHDTADAILREADALAADGPKAARGRKPDKEVIKEHGARVAALQRWSVASGNTSRANGMLSSAVPYRQVTTLELDARPNILNVGNGSLDLDVDIAQIGRFQARAPARDDRITRLAPVTYDPESTAPKFQAFLDQILPDIPVQLFVQRWMGYCLTGDTGQQVLAIAFGSGANGKTTLFDLFQEVLGDYAATVDIKTFLHDERRRGGDATPDLARLPGRRLVLASEPEAGDRVSETMVKTITGGDRLVARSLYGEPFEFAPSFKLILLSNVRPTIRGQDEGIWRRIILVPFEQVIPPDKRRPKNEVIAELRAESAGILNWMLDGLLMFREQGLAIPESIRAATNDYRAENDAVGQFVAAATEPDPKGRVSATRLYGLYCDWCKANAHEPWTQTRFGRRMGDLKYRRETTGIAYYMGLRVVQEQFGDQPQAVPEVIP